MMAIIAEEVLRRAEKEAIDAVEVFVQRKTLKKIVILKNLKPAVIRGVKSEGMLLAAEGKGGISLLTVDRDIEDGARIR
ncbi:MAG: hypothetical protein DRO63_03635 [Candidatus Gerdarchaeota archaeon]|nr:MAG: hypothetical protein DRO63_03635 [Candidatus Gerdarchaeota archaeon]